MLQSYHFLDFGVVTVSVFITTCGTFGATVVIALVGFVTALPAVVIAQVLEVLGVLVAVALATVTFCLLFVGAVTAVVNFWTLFFSLLYLACVVLLLTSELIAFFIMSVIRSCLMGRVQGIFISAFAATGLGLGGLLSTVFKGHSLAK